MNNVPEGIELEQFALDERHIPLDDFRRICELQLPASSAENINSDAEGGEVKRGKRKKTINASSARAYHFVYRYWLGALDAAPGEWLALGAADRITEESMIVYAESLLRFSTRVACKKMTLLGVTLRRLIPELDHKHLRHCLNAGRRHIRHVGGRGVEKNDDVKLKTAPIPEDDRPRFEALREERPVLRPNQRVTILSKGSLGRIEAAYGRLLGAAKRLAPELMLPGARRASRETVEHLLHEAADAEKPWAGATILHELKFAFDNLFPEQDWQWIADREKELDALKPRNGKRKQMPDRAVDENLLSQDDKAAIAMLQPGVGRQSRPQGKKALRKKTLKSRRIALLYFLGALSRRAPDLLPLPLPKKITPATIELFIDDLKETCSCYTIAMVLRAFALALSWVSPEVDRNYIRARASEVARQEPKRPRKKHGVDARVLITTGKKWMDDALARLKILAKTKSTLFDERKIAARYMDGLILVLWTIDPLRLQNFSDLRVSISFLEDKAGYKIAFRSEDMKPDRHHIRRVPRRFNSYVADYLNFVIKKINPDVAKGVLFVSSRGGALSWSGMQKRAPKITENATGVALSPKAFRPIAATAAAQHVGVHPRLAGAVLDDHSQDIVETAYIESMSVAAQLDHAAAIDDLIPPRR